ncbi:MAG: hypothetical protein FJ087_03040 [Deltaproteobacteria bacterium]|nr:hypothetical protein [Deltaproteobacteria bacterium]
MPRAILVVMTIGALSVAVCEEGGFAGPDTPDMAIPADVPADPPKDATDSFADIAKDATGDLTSPDLAAAALVDDAPA